MNDYLGGAEIQTPATNSFQQSDTTAIGLNEQDQSGHTSMDTEAQSFAAHADEIVEVSDGFEIDDFQVVRREFFAHTCEPSISFNNCKIYVNAACLNRFPTADFVQILVNRDSKVLAIRPCDESERDAFSWCSFGNGRRKAKQITCKLFFAKVVELMDWNPDYRYKLLGKVIHSNDEYLIAFDLSATEVYERIIVEGEKPKNKRTPVFPVGWQDQFGLPFREHRKSMQINIFDGYAVYSIKDNTISSPSAQTQDAEAQSPDEMMTNEQNEEVRTDA